MFVSRKNLPFIHLLPGKTAPGPYVPQSFHQAVEFPS